jgi:hypothetical protein
MASSFIWVSRREGWRGCATPPRSHQKVTSTRHVE